MNRIELKKELLANNVPEISFSVEGIKDGECMCLLMENNCWKVVYNSRGNIMEIESFVDETKACEFMYKEMKQEYGWA